MADVKIGISGSEITVASTIAISLPTDIGVRRTTAPMSNGSIRYACFPNQRRWQLSWVQLTAAELAALVTLCGYNQELRYQDNYESATWYTVVITSFAYDMINPGATTQYYVAQMSIEESV
jgi:hypothetical protein